MENKTLNSQESLELIAAMIHQSRQKLERGGGTLFLIWGYTSLLVSAAVVSLIFLTNDYVYSWFWWAIPLIGFTVQYIFKRNHPRQVKTSIDRFIDYVWLSVGAAAVLMPTAAVLSSYFGVNQISGFYYLPIITIILSIGVSATGMILKFKPLTIGGFASMVLGGVMFATSSYQVYLFMCTFIVSMIIPGHKLNYRAKCSKS